MMDGICFWIGRIRIIETPHPPPTLRQLRRAGPAPSPWMERGRWRDGDAEIERGSLCRTRGRRVCEGNDLPQDIFLAAEDFFVQDSDYPDAQLL